MEQTLCCTVCLCSGKGIRRWVEWSPPLAWGQTHPYVPILFLYYILKIYWEETLTLCSGFHYPNISGEWDRNDNWLKVFDDIFHTFPTECKGRRKEGGKLIAQRFSVYLNTNLYLKRAKITVLYKSVLSFLFESKIFLIFQRNILWELFFAFGTVLKWYPSIVILLQLPGSLK